MKQIKYKLNKNKAIISKADKGNSTVVLYLDDYNCKVIEFVSTYNFTTPKADITKTLQKELRNTINECQNLIQKSEKWKLVNLNPTAPTMNGLIKVHKEGTPIRPVINWRITPGYKLAQAQARKLTSYIPLHIQHKEHSPADG